MHNTDNDVTTIDPVEHLAALERRVTEAHRARHDAEQAERKAEERQRDAEIEARDLRNLAGLDNKIVVFRSEDEPTEAEEAVRRAEELARSALAQLEAARDVIGEALGRERDANREWNETANDPSLAEARCVCLRARLDDAIHAHEASKAKAADAARVLAEHETRHAKLASVAMTAREAFDDDESKRSAYVKAKAAQEDAKIDLDRAKRLSADAAGIEKTDGERVLASRVELAKSETSTGMINFRTAPIVKRMSDALGELVACRVTVQELDREMRSTLLAAGVSVANVRSPDMTTLRSRALDELEKRLTTEDERVALRGLRWAR
jgi:hypothetical protein